MARFVPAYDRRTGRKLPHFIPEAWFDHPVLGQHVRRTPRNAAANRTTTTNAPASGVNEKE